MKRIITKAAMALTFLAGATSASADVQVHLTEQFQSGATFDGVLTFTDGFAGLSGVAGTLSGALYGTNPINWVWSSSFGGPTAGIDFDGDATTFEDWLMSGPAQTSDPLLYIPYIGISWAPSSDGVLRLALNSDTYQARIFYLGGSDLAVSYTVSAVPEPETYAMMLAGLGLIGAIGRRRQKCA